MSRVRALVAAVLGALSLAACGSSSTTQTVPVTAPSTITTTGTSTTPATTPTTTTSTTSTIAAAPPPCRTADFALRFLGQAGATGHGELGFALRNISGHRCHTYGYPGILFLDKAGSALPTKGTRTTVDFFGNTTEMKLVVRPGASVSFRLGVNHLGPRCTTAWGLQVIAPDDTVTTHTTIPPPGAAECGAQATVSPLQPDATAFAH